MSNNKYITNSLFTQYIKQFDKAVKSNDISSVVYVLQGTTGLTLASGYILLNIKSECTPEDTLYRHNNSDGDFKCMNKSETDNHPFYKLILNNVNPTCEDKALIKNVNIRILSNFIENALRIGTTVLGKYGSKKVTLETKGKTLNLSCDFDGVKFSLTLPIVESIDVSSDFDLINFNATLKLFKSFDDNAQFVDLAIPNSDNKDNITLVIDNSLFTVGLCKCYRKGGETL